MADPNLFRGSESEILARRASSFGARAATYAAERPDYPDAAVTWALEPVLGRSPLRVLDLGAGTGKLTQTLARRPIQVIAVEPDAGMLAELRRLLPSVRSLSGSAEAIPLPDASMDAVVVGQAMHWFDLDRALPEIARVLVPDGVLAGLWNLDDDRVPWVQGLKRVAESRVSVAQWRPADFPLAGRYFAESEHASFPHSQRRTAESMVATITTHSHISTLDPAERSTLLGHVLDFLHATPETADGEFDLPIVTAVIRTQRNQRHA